LLSNTDSNNYYGTAVLAPNGTLFIPSRIYPEWNLISFDTTNDVPSDRIWIPEQLGGMALAADGTTLFTASGTARTYDIPTCQQLWWTQSVGGGSAPRVMADGTMVSCTQPGGVIALHPETGEILWTYDRSTPQDSYSTPAIGRDGTVYVGGGNKKFYAIRDGALVWESQDATTWDFNCSPSIGPDGTVYCGDADGWLWAFGPGSAIYEPDDERH
jgi:outer membrane protein assembly factor BamB